MDDQPHRRHALLRSRFRRIVRCIAISCLLVFGVLSLTLFAEPKATFAVHLIDAFTDSGKSRLRTSVKDGGQYRFEDDVRQISQPSDAPVPEDLLPLSEQPSFPADVRVQNIRPTIPAAKMTLRVAPIDRQLGGLEQPAREGGGSGWTIRSVQQEIESHEQSLEPGGNRELYYSNYNWENELPYGKYLYIHHAPLLFEDIPLERYGEGHGHCVQPVISFFKFVGTVPLLPYKVPVDYWAAYHYDAWYSFDQYGNTRPGITEGRFFPPLCPLKDYRQSLW